MNDDSLEAMVRLAVTPGLGPRAVARLLDEFSSAQAALSATPAEWQGTLPRGAELHRGASAGTTARAAERVLADCAASGISPLALGDERYPKPLAAIHDPPPVLYVHGTLPSAGTLPRCAALVGTRKPSDHGLSFARRLAQELGAAGGIVVSGLAMGIDAEAHRGVVEVGGMGIAVLPAGLDRIHPPVHRKLAKELCEHGCLISEQPPGTSVVKGHFVGRNRLISGMSQVVVVVEAGERSGALLTANYALEQGRTVFAMPGRPGDSRVAGALKLLQEGAGLVLSAADVADELNLTLASEKRGFAGLCGHEAFAAGYASFDALLAASGMSAPELLTALGRLEIAGRIRRGSDGLYYLTGV